MAQKTTCNRGYYRVSISMFHRIMENVNEPFEYLSRKVLIQKIAKLENSGGMGGWLGGMGGWLGRKTWHFFRFLARRYAPAPKIEKNNLEMAAEIRWKSLNNRQKMLKSYENYNNQ